MEKKLQKNIDHARFIASSLSYFADNLTEEIHKIKCKYGHSNETCKTCEFKYKKCEGMKVT